MIGCDNPATPLSESNIKIGIIAPNTGSDSALGEYGIEGVKLALKLNPSLKHGNKVELIFEDDRSDPDMTVAALGRLATDREVLAILLLSGSNSAIAAAKVADKYQTPVLVTIATNPDVTQHSKLFSQLVFDDNFQATVAAMFVRDELFITRVAVFSNPKSAYSSRLASVFAEKFKGVGGQITNFVELSDKSLRYNELLVDIRRNDPELFYMPVSESTVLDIVESLDSLDWSPTMMGSDSLVSAASGQHNSDQNLADGMLATGLFSSDMRLSPYGKRFSKYVDKESVNTYMLTGMEGYGILINAINQCDIPISRECINQQIRSTDNFIGYAGKISIDYEGKAHRALFINRIEGEAMETVVKVN